MEQLIDYGFTSDSGWEGVETAISQCKGIAWDTCHKIYILMDDRQMDLMREYGYDPLISASDSNAYDLFAKVQEWYEESCGLRFVNAVQHCEENPNAGFTDIIPQGWGEDEACEDCGYDGCSGACNDYDEPEDDEDE